MSFLDTLTINLNNSIHRYPEALDYLASRNITLEDVENYEIGYSGLIKVPEDGSLDRKRFMEETLKGITLEKTLIFPLKNSLGNVIGILSRKIDTKNYIKFFSSEAKFTGCFFNLDRALPHIFESKIVFLVEGVFDLIPFAKVIPNTVCVLTVGLSESQYELLSFYCNYFITVFDNDRAGFQERDKLKEKWNNIYSLNWGTYKDASSCRNKLSEVEFKNFIINNVNSRLVGLLPTMEGG